MALMVDNKLQWCGSGGKQQSAMKRGGGGSVAVVSEIEASPRAATIEVIVEKWQLKWQGM